MRIKTEEIPIPLRLRNQWVLWKFERRNDKPTKVPYQCNGAESKSNDESTWAEFASVERRYVRGGYDGIGFVFAANGGLCGVDLDGCRDPKTGAVSGWAREIILAFGTYAEVSPTETGVKLFCVGKSPFSTGKRISVLHADKVCDKEPGIEIYDHGRYFAVTGWRLQGPKEPQECNEALTWLAGKYAPAAIAAPTVDFRSTTAVVERARKYLSKLPPAVSGQRGHDKTFHVACVLVLGFGLSESEALPVILEWNQFCQPPWTERELARKLSEANKQPGERCYLRNAKPERWDSISVPGYAVSAPSKNEPKITILSEAAFHYLDELKNGKGQLIEIGLNDVDYALGGGVERGEVIVLGARPSHGKSAIALQCVHTWTGNKRPCFIASEEMSARLLGKRTVQYVSETPQEHWRHQAAAVEGELQWYAENHAPCYIAESCGTAATVVEQIERAVIEHEVEAVVVDYLQLLRGPGKSKYDQVSDASMALKSVTKKHNLVTLLLCQLSRAIESRQQFQPVMSDLKESGQIEQDADVILFLVWPHRIDSKFPAHEYKVYVAKNRNREINERIVMCRFEPSRQMLCPPRLKDRPNYDPSFDEWSKRADVGAGSEFQ
jgi:replicative DNA helicase